MTWILPALIAPLIWAIVNLIDDNLVRHVFKGAHVGAIISGFFGLVPAILIFATRGGSTLPVEIMTLSLAAGFLNIIYYYFYFKGLEVEHPSVVVALFSLTPALIPFAAYFLVDERLSAPQIAGFSLVVGSALVYSIADLRKPKLSRALFPVLLAALIFDLIALINKYVYTKADFYDSYLYFSLGMFLGGLYFFYVILFAKKRGRLRDIARKNSLMLLVVLALAELLNIVAEYVRNFALSRGPVSLVQAVSNLQPLYILIISLALFPLFPKFFPEAKSKNMRLKFILCLVMVGGVFLAVG